MSGAANRWARHAADIEAAVAHHRAGRLDRAATLYRRVLDKAPDHPDALHMLGVIATSRGKPEHAIRLIGRAMPTIANMPDAHLNLGNAHHVAGRPAEATACYRRAIALAPDFALAHSSLGRELNATEAFAEALPHCQRALALDPGMAEAWLHAGTALRGLGRLAEAEAALRAALARRPDFAEAMQVLGVIAVETSRFPEAVEWQRRVVALRHDDPRARRALGVSLFRTGSTEAALAELRRTVEGAPEFVPGWTSLGWAYRALGRFDEAVASFEQALAIDPDAAEARRSLAATGGQLVDDAELQRLAGLLADPTRPVNDRAAAGFARGDLLDKAVRYDEAFACFAEANALSWQTLCAMGRGYDTAAMQARVDALIATWTPELLRAVAEAGSDSDLPVFIVGMPRAGTTLVEQIAASHSQVFGAGELTEIGRIADRLSPPDADARAPARWAGAARPLGAAHLTHLAALGGGAARVIDKLPDNLLNLDVIAALFPGARVIFCERDPRDVCVSNYFQLFAGGNPWSYDLAACGHRAREAARLAAHWRATLPLAMHTVRYESLVADLEGESRRLIGFLGLEWQPACLDFHRTERVVVTQSTWQVRQKLFTQSVGRWRNYERHLATLFAALGDAG